MPEVWIPSLMRRLTDGLEQVQVPGETIREVIENLEAKFSGDQGANLRGWPYQARFGGCSRRHCKQ